MTEPLFFSQSKLESWIEKGEVTFHDNVLTLSAEKRSYTVQPAVRVLSLIDGKDTKGLLGKTLSVADLVKLGAEHFPKTVLLGDTGYECEEGFIGEVHGAPAAAPPKPAAPAPSVSAPTPQAATPPTSDAELIADFLLKHL